MQKKPCKDKYTTNIRHVQPCKGIRRALYKFGSFSRSSPGLPQWTPNQQLVDKTSEPRHTSHFTTNHQRLLLSILGRVLVLCPKLLSNMTTHPLYSNSHKIIEANNEFSS